MTDTIAAVATGDVISAIGIVRVSGDNALTAADNMFNAAGGVKLKDFENRRMYYGELVDANNELVDLCLCVVSHAPESYTGEDTVEFHCHGSPVVLSEIMRLLLKNGVRQAAPGEFTKRAFLNGRMDLTQAEAVIDLIQSESSAAAKNAAGQLRGAISLKLESVYDRLIEVMAHFHAVIDYPDEDIDAFDMINYFTALKDNEDRLRQMLETYERGRVLRDGVPTAIIGRTNTGKSSLFNTLLGYDRVIVTDIAGTTRDTIEEKILIGNVLLRLIDTAGFRKTTDIVENMGVERTLAALNSAKLVILVLDGSEPLRSEDYDILHLIPPDIPKIAAVNKSDLPPAFELAHLDGLGVKWCSVSALTGEGLDKLDAEIQNMFHVYGLLPESGISSFGEIITNNRQADAISRAANSLGLAAEALISSVTPDAVVTDIEAALAAIGEVTGKTMREDILNKVFERFCVGK